MLRHRLSDLFPLNSSLQFAVVATYWVLFERVVLEVKPAGMPVGILDLDRPVILLPVSRDHRAGGVGCGAHGGCTWNPDGWRHVRWCEAVFQDDP